MKTIPAHISDPKTIAKLNQIKNACESIRERRRLLAKIIQANHHSKTEFTEYRDLSATLNTLEKAWEELTPSLLSTALLRMTK